MRGDYNNIDELFSSELKGYLPPPPEKAWEGIEHKLAARKVRKPVFLLRRAAAAIAILIAGSLATFWILNDEEQITQSVAQFDSEEGLKSIAEQSEVKADKEVESNNDLPTSDLQLATIAQKNLGSDGSEGLQHKSQPAEVKQDIAPVTTENNPSVVITEQIDDSQMQLIAGKEANVSGKAIQEQLVYEPEKQEYSDAYLAFLSEFEEIDSYDDRKKWALGGQVGPQYAYRQLSSNDVAQELIDEYNSSEDGLMAYAGGINIAYKPARRLSIQSGVYYSKMGHSSPATPIESVQDFVAPGALIPGQEQIISNSSDDGGPAQLRVSSSFGEIKSQNTLAGDQGENYLDPLANEFNEVSSVEQHLEYIEIPFIARYAIIDRKVNFHLLGGVSTNFLIASPVYLDNGTFYTDAQNLSKINYSSTVGVGLGYSFSSFAVSVEPQFKYYLNKVNTNTSTNVHPYSFGVFTGVTYLF